MTTEFVPRKTPASRDISAWHALDTYLLRHYPIIWASRVHAHIPWALAAFAVVIGAAWIVRATHYSVATPNRTYLWVLSLAAISLFTFGQFLQPSIPTTGDRAPNNPLQQLGRFLGLTAWAALLAATPLCAALASSGLHEDLLFQSLVSLAAALWLAAAVFTSPRLAFEVSLGIYMAAVVFGLLYLLAVALLFPFRPFLSDLSSAAAGASGALFLLVAYRVIRVWSLRLLAVPLVLSVPLVFTIGAVTAHELSLARAAFPLAVAAAALAGGVWMGAPWLRPHYSAVRLSPGATSPLHRINLTAILRSPDE
jgi:hypothetical protein